VSGFKISRQLKNEPRWYSWCIKIHLIKFLFSQHVFVSVCVRCSCFVLSKFRNNSISKIKLILQNRTKMVHFLKANLRQTITITFYSLSIRHIFKYQLGNRQSTIHIPMWIWILLFYNNRYRINCVYLKLSSWNCLATLSVFLYFCLYYSEL
jgi:hypothetical protein